MQNLLEIITEYKKVTLRRDSVGSSGTHKALVILVVLDHAGLTTLTLLNFSLSSEFDMIAAISI